MFTIRKVDKYIIGLLTKMIFFVSLFMMLLANFNGLSSQIWMIEEYNSTFIELLGFRLYFLPVDFVNGVSLMLPVAMAITMVILQKNSEVIAYVSLGGSVFSLAKPFVIVATILMLIVFVMENYINPKVRVASHKYESEVIRGKDFVQTDSINYKLLTDGKNYLGFYDRILPVDRVIFGAKEFIIDEKGIITGLKTIESATHDGNISGISSDESWSMSNVAFFSVADGFSKVSKYLVETCVSDCNYSNFVKLSAQDRLYMSLPQLIHAINVMSSQGINTERYYQIIFRKLGNVFAVFVTVVYLFPLGLSFGRAGAISLVGRLAFWSFIYILTVLIAQTLGDKGDIKGIYAYILPHFIFLAIAVNFYRKMR